MQIYRAGHYDSERRWIDGELMLIGVGSAFSAEHREGADDEHGTWHDSGRRTKVDGTVHQITDDAVHVQYADGDGAVAAHVDSDRRIELNTRFEAIRFGTPPVPVAETFAGDVGYEEQLNCANVQLHYDPKGGWYLESHVWEHSFGVPDEIWNKRVLSYELGRASIAVLRDDDRDRFVEPLGDDLPELLARIAGGHSIGWNGRNLAGEFTPDAWEAHEELENRIENAENSMPETLYAREFSSTGSTPATPQSKCSPRQRARRSAFGGAPKPLPKRWRSASRPRARTKPDVGAGTGRKCDDALGSESRA